MRISLEREHLGPGHTVKAVDLEFPAARAESADIVKIAAASDHNRRHDDPLAFSCAGRGSAAGRLAVHKLDLPASVNSFRDPVGAVVDLFAHLPRIAAVKEILLNLLRLVNA
mgnify:CR=1 FL=1